MPEIQNLEDITVVDGKLIREMPSSRLDAIITGGTERITRLTTRIAELEQERNKCQARINQATILKAELEAKA